MGFLSFRKKNKKHFTNSTLPELIFDKDTDSNISSVNSSPVSDSFVRENHISIFSQNSLLDDILNELPKKDKYLYSSTVNSDVFTDYSRLSESTKSDSSIDGTGFYSNSTYGIQNVVSKKNVLHDRASESDIKDNTIKMRLPHSIVVEKNQPSLPNFRRLQVDKSFRSSISNSMSTQCPLKAKNILKTVNNTKESIPLNRPPVTGSQKNLAELNNMSISRMKERHRQECRKSGQLSHTSNNVQLQTLNSTYNNGNQRQQVQQRSPIIAPPSSSVKYQVYTSSVSSRTKCNPLPLQNTVVAPSDQNRIKYGSLSCITGQRYQNTQENVSRPSNGIINYGRRTNSQYIECYPQKHQVRDIHNRSLKHQSAYSKNSCLLQKQTDSNGSLRVSPCIKQNKDQKIIKLGEIFEKHMSNNPKLKAEIDRVPHVYNKNHHSVPHSLYLMANEKPKLAHKLKVDTLIRRKGREVPVKATNRNPIVDFNERHERHYCSKIVDVHSNHRNFLYPQSRFQVGQRSNLSSAIHEYCSKKGYVEAPSEPSETYNEKKIRSINVTMGESRYNQDYKNYYRH